MLHILTLALLSDIRSSCPSLVFSWIRKILGHICAFLRV